MMSQRKKHGVGDPPVCLLFSFFLIYIFLYDKIQAVGIIPAPDGFPAGEFHRR
jgi:hypothetical protein